MKFNLPSWLALFWNDYGFVYWFLVMSVVSINWSLTKSRGNCWRLTKTLSFLILNVLNLLIWKIKWQHNTLMKQKKSTTLCCLQHLCFWLGNPWESPAQEFLLTFSFPQHLSTFILKCLYCVTAVFQFESDSLKGTGKYNQQQWKHKYSFHSTEKLKQSLICYSIQYSVVSSLLNRHSRMLSQATALSS